MKRILSLIALSLLLLSSCKKNCDTVTDTYISDEERVFVVSSARTYTFISNAGDTDNVHVSAPVYAVTPGSENCDHPGNQYVDQTWTSGQFGNFAVHMEHYNGPENTRLVTLTHSSGAAFSYDIISPAYTTLVIASNTYFHVLVDSTVATGNGISKVFYGNNVGILRVEKANGEVWEVREP